MTRDDALDLMLLLSAIESWAMSCATPIQDHMLDRIAAAWESGERRPPAATWELWLLRMRMHPHYELLPRRGYSPASGPAQARTT